MDQLIKLLDVIVWPLTVLIGLLFFRKHIGKIISSLGSIKAGAQGFEMNFIEEKLQEATKLIGINSSGIEAKSGGDIITKDSRAVTPHKQLLEIRDALNNKIRDKAIEGNISITNISSNALTEKLINNNVISRQSARNFNTLMELTNIGTHHSMTQTQINQVKALYNNLTL